jgi:hypothetical protein
MQYDPVPILISSKPPQYVAYNDSQTLSSDFLRFFTLEGLLRHRYE